MQRFSGRSQKGFVKVTNNLLLRVSRMTSEFANKKLFSTNKIASKLSIQLKTLTSFRKKIIFISFQASAISSLQQIKLEYSVF